MYYRQLDPVTRWLFERPGFSGGGRTTTDLRLGHRAAHRRCPPRPLEAVVRGGCRRLVLAFPDPRVERTQEIDRRRLHAELAQEYGYLPAMIGLVVHMIH
jgi:hypothetical protein